MVPPPEPTRPEGGSGYTRKSISRGYRPRSTRRAMRARNTWACLSPEAVIMQVSNIGIAIYLYRRDSGERVEERHRGTER
jgi:hypothetical protein